MCILGKIPPPIGGVTVYTKRLVQAFSSYPNVFFQEFSYRNILGVIRSLIISDTIHLNISNPYARFFFSFISLLTGTKLIITYHGNLGRFKAIKNAFDFGSVIICKVPIVLNQSSYLIAKKLNKHSLLNSTFIPPLEVKELKTNIKEAINKFKYNGNYIACTNASNISFDFESNEIYGISALLRLFEQFDNFKLIISDPSGNYRKYINYNFPQLLGNAFWISEPHDFCGVIKMTDCFIRNTSTDGDSVSIHEALYFERVTFATDVVSRPLQCITYCNIDELKNNLLNFDNLKNKFIPKSDPSSIDTLRIIYFNS